MAKNKKKKSSFGKGCNKKPNFKAINYLLRSEPHVLNIVKNVYSHKNNYSIKLNNRYMKRLLFPLFVLLVSCGTNNQGTFTIAGLEKDIMVLASDSLEGRAPFSRGEAKTLAYLQFRMEQIGLKPAFNGSYLQEVPLAEITSFLPESILFKAKSKKYTVEVGADISCWSPMLQQDVTINNSELVFVGFGINAPELEWNDFEGIDLKGKTVVVLVNDPGFLTQDSTLFNGNAMTFYGRWPYKYLEANLQGAEGCIIVHEDKAAGYPWAIVNRDAVNSNFFLNNKALANQVTKFNGWITENAAIDLFSICGLNYEQLKIKACEKGFKPIPMGITYSVDIKNTWTLSNSYNVGGVIEGSKRPEEALVYEGHWDHLGIGSKVDGDSIYNGASDNAAAIAWMFSIAEAFKASGEKPERSILFFSPTAEESGMLGSHHYIDNPVFAHENTVACFNSDVIMFLGKFKDVTVTGLGHSELDDYLKQEAQKQGRYVCSDPNPENGMFFRSDQLPFLRAGIPSLFAKGYSHQVDLGREETLRIVDEYWHTTYHKPADQYNPNIHNLEGLLEDAILFYNLGKRIANETYFPKWSKNSEFFVER